MGGSISNADLEKPDKKPKMSIFDAASQNSIHLEKWLKKDPYALFSRKNDRTPMYHAIESGRLSNLQLMIQRFPKLLTALSCGRSLAYTAVYFNKPHCLEYILNQAKDTETMRTLLFNPNDTKTDSPAILAAMLGNTACLRIIAEKCPISLMERNQHGHTAARLIADYEENEKNQTCLLILAQASPQSIVAPSDSGLQIPGRSSSGLQIPGRSSSGENAAHAAARTAKHYFLEIFAKYAPESFLGRNVVHGNTPLHLVPESRGVRTDMCFRRIAQYAPTTLFMKNKLGQTPMDGKVGKRNAPHFLKAEMETVSDFSCCLCCEIPEEDHDTNLVRIVLSIVTAQTDFLWRVQYDP
jgi:hypothetical protein